MLDKIKGLKKYTDCSMPTNENELREKESVAGYNQAIEDVVKIFSIYDVSQRSKLFVLFAEWLQNNGKWMLPKEQVKEFFKEQKETK
tara:strand:- start:56 stop:316 length:261 start_codon:yes stop_codon:yes gene_type:complete